MSGQQKKVSLFKQKIAQAKAKMQIKEIKESGFPVAPKIIEKEEQIAEQLSQPSKYQIPQGFLHHLKGQSMATADEIGKIQSENWNKVSSMSEQQREAAIAQLRSQLPSGFLKKVEVKKAESRKEQPVLSQVKNQKKQIEENQVNEKDYDQQQTDWRTLLKINIENNILECTENSQEHLVDLKKLTEFIGSQNNQSQVIGGSIIAKWGKLISNLATTKTRELIYVSNIPLHGGLITVELVKIIKMGLKQATCTTYKSIFIELCTSLMETIKDIAFLMSRLMKKQLSQTIFSLISRIQHFDIAKADAIKIRDSLASVNQFLLIDEEEQELQWTNLKDSIDAIIELTILEKSSELEGYWIKALHSVEKCSDLQQLLQMLSFFYEFVNKLVIKRNMQPYISIEYQRGCWGPAIELLLSKFSKSFWNIEAEDMFQAILLGRFVGGTCWETLVKIAQVQGEKNHLVNGMLLFNTLPDLTASSVSQEQVSALNMIFDWLSCYLMRKGSLKISPNNILATFLELFLQEEEYYSQLKQETLEMLIKRLYIQSLVSFENVISIEQIRTLTKNYNYNSFGNKAFSLLLLIIAATCNPEKEALILRQSLLPCWKQFLELGKYFEDIPKTKIKESNRELKDEMIQKIRGEQMEEGEINFLVQYLS